MDERPPLDGVRVVEDTASLAGAYTGFLLAGLGAEVVRVESPATRRTPGEHVLHRGRASVARGACWDALVAGADVVLTDEAGPEVALAPGLIHCRVSAWDGAADLPPDEALLAASTGMQAMQWSWSRRPVWFVTPMIGYMTGLLGALGVTAALLARRRGAPGQRVDASGLGAAMALNSGTYVSGAETRGSLSQFGDPRGQIATYSLFPTADGWLFIGALTPAFLVKLMTVLDRVDLLADPRLQAPPLAFGVPDIKALVRDALDPILRRRQAADWVRILREADIPCGALQSRAEALADAEARALGIVVPVDDPVLGPTWQPGPPAVFSATPLPPPRPAPVAGADT
ncbi:MAG TPA: CoA transferase, partial [Candidatus Binatia bacterium]|nr:CoA transferase [Candidatus Binatia bacterium]